MRMNYEMEELLPIVAELAEKYTSKESTSISYETARQLMEAVVYCINQYCSNQCEGGKQLTVGKRLSAKEAYKMGYENVIQKVKVTQDSYNEMITHFCAYGNENYQDTVTKAIPGFFQHYDVRYAPQEIIITMDYPTICPIINCSGIDAIKKYVEYISYEQKFMGALPQEYVYEVLYKFQSGYRKQFYNICSIILRHILGHMMIGKCLGNTNLEEDYEMLRGIIREHDTKWIETTFSEFLKKLIREKYSNDNKLKNYLQADLKNFTTQIYVSAQNNSIQNVVVL